MQHQCIRPDACCMILVFKVAQVLAVPAWRYRMCCGGILWTEKLPCTYYVSSNMIIHHSRRSRGCGCGAGPTVQNSARSLGAVVVNVQTLPRSWSTATPIRWLLISIYICVFLYRLLARLSLRGGMCTCLRRLHGPVVRYFDKALIALQASG